MNNEGKEAYIAHQNVSHFSDGKHHNKVIDGMPDDIGMNFDWSELLFREVVTYQLTEPHGLTRSVNNMPMQSKTKPKLLIILSFQLRKWQCLRC